MQYIHVGTVIKNEDLKPVYHDRDRVPKKVNHYQIIKKTLVSISSIVFSVVI